MALLNKLDGFGYELMKYGSFVYYRAL